MPRVHQFEQAANPQLTRKILAPTMVEIGIIYSVAHDHSVCMQVETREGSLSNVRNLWEFDMHDFEIDVRTWREYGQSVKRSKTIKSLHLTIEIHGAPDRLIDITPERAQCFRAFFEKAKGNQSILWIKFDMRLITAVSPLDLGYFIENNKSLSSVELWGSCPVSRAQSAHVFTALLDKPLNSIWIECFFVDNGAYEQILLACKKVNSLSVRFCSRNYYFFAALAATDTDVGEYLLPDLDIERAEDETLAILNQNVTLQMLSVPGLFSGIEAEGRFINLLCNTSSIESVCQSNHILQRLDVSSHAVQNHCRQYLELNAIPDKRKVVQLKVMKYYLSQHFDASPLPNMPLVALPRVLGISIDVPKRYKCSVPNRYKCSAIFNILKSTPQLFEASSRGVGKAETHSEDTIGPKHKQQKVA